MWSEDGVLVLMDLGSAVLSAELALDLLDEERRATGAADRRAPGRGRGRRGGGRRPGRPPGGGGRSRARRPDGEGVAPRRGQCSRSSGLTGAAPAPGGRRGRASRTSRPDAHRHRAQRAGPPRATGGAAGAHRRRLRRQRRGQRRDQRSRPGERAQPQRRSRRSAPGSGDELALTASGAQAAEALDAVRRLAEDGFGEPEDLGGGRAAEGPARGRAGRERARGHTPRRPGSAHRTARRAGGGRGTGAAAGAGAEQALPLAPRPTPRPSGRRSSGALSATAADIRGAQASIAGRTDTGDAAIFDAHLLFLEDEALLGPAHDGVFSCHEPATRAWEDAVDAAAAGWDGLEDAYQRARAADLRGVGDQVLPHLAGAGRSRPGGPCRRGPGIVVAGDLTPADVAGLDASAVAGIACAFGGPTSHALILARALGLPAVVGAGASLLAVPDGTQLALDGDAGTVTVAPPADTLAAVERRRGELVREAAAARGAATTPAVTLDGVPVHVEANIAGPQDVPEAVAAGADGVGLLRTEFLFLGAAAMPDEDEQAAAYEAVAAALDGRPLTIRTLDAGADKPLPYLPQAAEANPFLGVRGLRLGLLHPDQLRCQFRALLRVAATRPLRVMLPMVSTVDEVRRAREAPGEASASLEARGAAVPARLELGIMLEVPVGRAGRAAPRSACGLLLGGDQRPHPVRHGRRARQQRRRRARRPAATGRAALDRAAASAAAAAGRPVTVCGEVGRRPSRRAVARRARGARAFDESHPDPGGQTGRAGHRHARRRPPRQSSAGRGVRRRRAAAARRRGPIRRAPASHPRGRAVR